MLVVAGYLNFTSNGDLKSAVQTASSEEELDKMANIGDAQLVSSTAIGEENTTEENMYATSNSISENNTVVSNKIDDNTSRTYRCQGSCPQCFTYDHGIRQCVE